MKEKNKLIQEQSEELAPRKLFKDAVKSLLEHKHMHQYSYVASYPISDAKTLTVVYEPFHNVGGIEKSSQYMAFVVEKIITADKIEMNLRESYFADGFVGVKYGVSIEGYTKPGERKIKLIDDQGEPDTLNIDVPEEVKKVLYKKTAEEEEIPEEEKIKRIIEIMADIKKRGVKPMKEKRHHIHWQLTKKHGDK